MIKKLLLTWLLGVLAVQSAFSQAVPPPTVLSNLRLGSTPVPSENKYVFYNVSTGKFELTAAASAPDLSGTSQRALFYKSIIGGDSGSPVFLLVNGASVLLGTWTFGGGGAGTFLTPHRTAINAAMHSLAVTDYQLTDVDLSGFPSY